MDYKIDIQQAERLREVADCLYDEGRYQDAADSYRQEINIEEKLASIEPGKYEKDIATALNAIGACMIKRGLDSYAENIFLKAESISQTFNSEQRFRSRMLIKTIYQNLSNLYVRSKDYDKAVEFEYKILNLINEGTEEKPNPWSDNSERGECYWALGVLYSELGFTRSSLRMRRLEKYYKEETDII